MSFEKHGRVVIGETPAIDRPGEKCARVDDSGEAVVSDKKRKEDDKKSSKDVDMSALI